MDTPLTLGYAVNMAGFIQATAYQLFTKRPFKHHKRDCLLYKLDRFQAYRFGMMGIAAGVSTGGGYHLSKDALRSLENIATSAGKVGATSTTEAIRLQVRNGHDKIQSMCDFAAEGRPSGGLVKRHCEIWTGL